MPIQSGRARKLCRRSFLKLVGGAGVLGATLGIAGCGASASADAAAGAAGWMPSQYNVPAGWPVQVRGRVAIAPDNPSITRDNEKCILCGQCIEVCKNVQSVFDNYELPFKEEIICIHCGQCTHWCPSGAITEVDENAKVIAALADPNKFVVVQMAPSTRVGLGEEFGFPVGTNVERLQYAALYKLGFDAVFDTNFSADLTIMEEGSELVRRVLGVNEHDGHANNTLPQFTSCCPGWVKYVEYYYPDLMAHLSSSKSPQQMTAPLYKTYYAETKGIDPKNIFSVSIMPCTAKKFEAARPEMNAASRLYDDPAVSADVDVVLTVRELARLIKNQGIDFNELTEVDCDKMMGEYTGAGAIFGATGGVMEAAVRSAYYLITGEQPPAALWELTPVRGLAGVKEAAVSIPGAGEVKVCVVSGLANAGVVMDRVRAGDRSYAFIEVMACPSGCQYGGGQPRSSSPPSDAVRTTRTETLYRIDRECQLRNSHDNPEITALYKNYLGEPGSELAELLLHTSYTSRAEKLTVKRV
ncbi:MAG: [FeFe] hydrogenase, group A [Gracilibacteraceae bacterium]|jgi:NADH-quinone oxidoreductase subunit G|nr:[FeFe] hydrogenase, group A [Gracilibacteraceae bacterium]